MDYFVGIFDVKIGLKDQSCHYLKLNDMLGGND